MNGPALPGVLNSRQLLRTAEHIAAQQLGNGRLPWFRGHSGDPWDHVESAMALDVCGLRAEARRAYRWSAEHQRADGSWPMEIVSDGTDRVLDASADSNQCAYLAVGIWHHWLATGDRAFVRELWPTVRDALDFVCDLQRPDGAIAWARDPAGAIHDEALLTGSSSIVQSLRCGTALAALVGDARPDWELALTRLAHTVSAHPQHFGDRDRFSMDWYYPVLGGAVRGAAARRRLAARWDEFVVPGRGVRCVADRPWVTAAETCELVLALDTLGANAPAHRLLADIQFCRAEDGGYWTGWVWPEDVFWPEERSTWTGAAVVLAVDALTGHTAAGGVFRGAGLPALPGDPGCSQHCEAEAVGLRGEP